MLIDDIGLESEKRGMTFTKQQVKNLFSEMAAEWAAGYADPEPRTLAAKNLKLRQQFALEMLEAVIPRSSKILDAGCGSGEIAAKLMERGYDVWGIDLTEPMIRRARKLCGSDQFQVGDIENIPFPDNTFDAAVSLGVIQYLPSEEQALREMRRVLKPGGQAVIAIPSGSAPLQRMDAVVVSLCRMLRPAYYLLKYRFRGRPAPSPETPAGIVHRRFYRGRWLRLLRGLSFEPEEWICYGWGWFRSPLGHVAGFLSDTMSAFQRGIERLFGSASFSPSGERFVRSRALNWLGSEQIVRVRLVK